MENTLADFPPDEYTIMAFCEACDREARVPVERLPRDLRLSQLRESLRCQECGHRGAEIRILYTAGGEYHYG